jgi:outer membrane protein OmpA-like peptidoglycan-associated protein
MHSFRLVLFYLANYPPGQPNAILKASFPSYVLKFICTARKSAACRAIAQDCNRANATLKEYIEMFRTIFTTRFSAVVLAASSFVASALLASSLVRAQEPNPTQGPPQNPNAVPMQQQGTVDGIPLYKIEVVARDIPAINYFHREGATKIGFQGTSLLPEATGEAKVEARLGRTSIDATIQGLSPANGFGPEYMTYVLWAITPEGRPVNLGEVLPSGSKDKSQLTVTTDLQAFGLIVTAEPYYAVTMPSDLVVAQNFVLPDKTQGVIEPVVAHYSLLPRGAYADTAGRHTVLNPVTRNDTSPLELYEAVNAVQIADAAGAGTYAADTMQTAKTALQNAEDLDTHKGDRKQTITYAREAVQSAEDARIITIRKIKAEDEAAQIQARNQAEQAAQQAQIVAQQQAAERAKAEAVAANAQADAANAQAEAQRAREAQAAAEQSAQQASQQAVQARERLRAQLNAILETTETARGLIVNMSDVLFDFNKYSLKPEAREKLAKVSGILLSYPGLKLQVEGYTDSIGSDEYNQKLSEQRADGVRQYLVSQNVADSNITAAGFGKNDPVADNSTSSGRAQNRRVELVVSGAAIGIEEQSAPGAVSQNPVPAASPQAGNVGSSEAETRGNFTGVSNPQQ